MDKYDHIQIERQEIAPTYRNRPYPNAPKPPERSRKQHGQVLYSKLTQASKSILAARQNIGIQTDSLMVLEISSEALPNEVLELLLNKFKLFLVEETSIIGTNKSKLVIQFENQEAINQFNKEREFWENDIKDNTILTYAQRRNLFCCIETVRSMTREDRIGKRLKSFINNKTDRPNFFIVNIDVWYNNDHTKIIEIERQIRQALGTEGSQLLGDLFEITGLLLGRAKVNEFSLNALLNMDIICSVELPFETISEEPCELYSLDFHPIVNDTLGENAPLAAVLDSGVFTGNPLLKSVVVAENEFDTTEHTTSDMNGHGTGIAGIVVYGDFSNSITSRIFKPLVRICNGKIMHDKSGNPCFPDDMRPEQIVKNAITYFHNNYGCRIFNLSVGDTEKIYNGGRQFAWASMLDDLSRDLDIVIIVSAGNVSSPIMDDFVSRDELMEKSRNQLFNPEHRLIDPATSALSITVGSITRTSEPSIPRGTKGITPISAGLEDYPSVFTRIGKGVNKAIKPDFVDYGGNYAVRQITRGDSRWLKNDQNLMEPSLNHTPDKIFKGFCGTSFSASHVTHMAARLERALEEQLNEKPSANLIRAMLANSAKYTNAMIIWGMDSKDIYYTGNDNPKRERLMRLNGYGKISEPLLKSTDNSVTLFAEDKLPLRDFHLYKIPVPQQFVKVNVSKSITISLAYNPITRLNRKEYLANNLWIEIFRRINEDDLIKYKAKKEAEMDTDVDFQRLPNSFKADFTPGYDTLQKSTLQQRRWQKSPLGGSDLLCKDYNESYIYILISGKERFKYSQQEQSQPYALSITFTYESEEHIDLYNQLKNNVRLKAPAKVKPKIKI